MREELTNGDIGALTIGRRRPKRWQVLPQHVIESQSPIIDEHESRGCHDGLAQRCQPEPC